MPLAPFNLNYGGKMKHNPPALALTDAQRLEGHRRSLALRQARAAVKQQIRDGLLTIEQAFTVDVAEGMRVAELLSALRGVGPTTVGRWLQDAGLKPDRTLKQCGPKQRERLLRSVRERK